MLITILECSEKVLSTLSHRLLRLGNSLTLPYSVLTSSTAKNQSDCENFVMNLLKLIFQYRVKNLPCEQNSVHGPLFQCAACSVEEMLFNCTLYSIE